MNALMPLKVFQLIIICIFIILLETTLQHYIPPPSACLLSSICNHTHINVCALENNKKCYKLFSDECYMFEYNCDNKAEYIADQMKYCKGTKTTMDKIPSEIFNISTTKPSTIKATKRTETTLISIKANSSKTTSETQKKNIDTTTSTNKTTATITIKQQRSTKANRTQSSGTITDTKLSLNISTKADISPTKSKSTSLPMTNSTIPVPTKTNMGTSFSSIDDATERTTITEATRLSTIYHPNTTIESVFTMQDTTVVEHTKLTTTIIEPKMCDSYPIDCDRPTKWDTTVKGETRDFWRILGDKYGKPSNAVQFKKYTSHSSRRSAISNIRKNGEIFNFARHVDVY